MEKDTYYCSFVSAEYVICSEKNIICECGDSFPNEAAFNVHLHLCTANSDNKKPATKKDNEKKVIVVKQETENDRAPIQLLYDPVQKRYIAQPIKNELLYVEEEAEEEVTKEEKPFIIMESDSLKEEAVVEEDDGEQPSFFMESLTEYIEEEIVEDDYEDIKYEVIDYDGICEVVVDPPSHEDVVCDALMTKRLFEEHNYDKERGDGGMVYACNVCNKTFNHFRSVHLHKRVHRTPAPRPHNCVCEVCGKKYASNAALRYHQRVHTGEKPFVCTFCPKKFTMPLFLQIHLRTHTGEKPYQCPHPQCPKAFGNKAALLRHDRVHTGVRPYLCPECGKSFTQSNSMKLHIRTVHLKLPAPYKSKARRAKRASQEPAPLILPEKKGSTFEDVDTLLYYKRQLKNDTSWD